MAEEEIAVEEPIEKEVDLEKPIVEKRIVETTQLNLEAWKPKTGLGKKVKNKEIIEIDQILDVGHTILEPEITETLLPNLTVELLMIGQSKGKFGGGQRRVFKQTQKKTNEGNKPRFSTMAVAGNFDGYVGIGYGKSKETVPAREKAIRNAKLNIIKLRRGCGSWQCGCKEPHSIPFKVEGKCGSARIALLPAPKGTGLKIQKECQKVLRLAGIKDIWSRSDGQTRSTVNLIYALEDAFRKLLQTKLPESYASQVGCIEGMTSQEVPQQKETEDNGK